MKRYTVLWKPPAYGYPFNTDYWLAAVIVLWGRRFLCLGRFYPCGARLIINCEPHRDGQ